MHYFVRIPVCLITASVCLLTTLSVSAEDEPALVFLLGGQSNMEGVGSNTGLALPYASPLPAIQIWRQTSTSFVNLAPGFGHQGVSSGQSNNFGPELAFGHEIAELYPDREIYFIKYAVGGTSLSDDWDPDGNNNPQYDTFIQRVSAALSSLDTAGVEYDVAGMLWMQGEQDAKFQGSGQAYGDNLVAFVDDMRDNYGNELNFVVGRLHDELPDRFLYDQDVRDGQTVVPDADLHMAYVDTDTFQVNGDDVHFGQAGQLSLGAGFATEMHALTTMHENADIDKDGFVGAADLDIVIARWGDLVATPEEGDVNGDGIVGTIDLQVVLANWSNGDPPDVNVPEPTSILFFASMAVTIWRTL